MLSFRDIVIIPGGNNEISNSTLPIINISKLIGIRKNVSYKVEINKNIKVSKSLKRCIHKTIKQITNKQNNETGMFIRLLNQSNKNVDFIINTKKKNPSVEINPSGLKVKILTFIQGGVEKRSKIFKNFINKDLKKKLDKSLSDGFSLFFPKA